MKLSTILRHVKSGEIKQMKSSVSDEDIVAHVNAALADIYARYPIKTEEAIISLVEGKTIYSLDGTDPDVDMGGDFEVLSIIEAYDENGKIGVNEDSDILGVFTTDYNKIQVPYATNGSKLGILFKPEPEEVLFVDDGNGGASEVVIPLPRVFLEPIGHYVGYRVHGSRNGNVDGENNTHLMRYEMSLKKIIDLGIITSTAYDRSVRLKGFK